MKTYSVEITHNASYEHSLENEAHESFVLPKGYEQFNIEADTIESAIDKTLYKLAHIANNPDDFTIDNQYDDEARISFSNCEDGMDVYYEVVELFS